MVICWVSFRQPSLRADFELRFNYVHFNPVKHGYVDRVKDWQFSSFHRYVKKGYYDEEWGNFNADVDFE